MTTPYEESVPERHYMVHCIWCDWKTNWNSDKPDGRKSQRAAGIYHAREHPGHKVCFTSRVVTHIVAGTAAYDAPKEAAR